MVALKTERRVFIWRIRSHCEPEEANEAVTIDQVVDILASEFQAGRARMYISDTGRFLKDDDPEIDEKNQLYIADLNRDEEAKTVTILVNRGDPTTVATAYLNPDANEVRVPQPQDHEAPGYSAHLVISTVPMKGKTLGQYPACFEQMPRVSGSLVMSLVNRILREATKDDRNYTYTVPVHTKQKIGSRMKRYRPVLSEKRIPSERLIDDLEKGVLSGVTLTKRASIYNGPGRDRLIRREEQRLVIRTNPAAPKVMTQFLRDLQEFARDESFETITFDLEKLPHNQSNKPTLVLDDQDAMEQLYVRAQIISGFGDVFLEACYPKICDPIANKMKDVLLADPGG